MNQALIQRRSLPIASIALIALVFAQSAAGWHWLKHLGAGSDTAGLPGTHVQLCLECASFAPVNAAHGSPCAPLVAAVAAVQDLAGAVVDASVVAPPRLSFRSRAPPR